MKVKSLKDLPSSAGDEVEGQEHESDTPESVEEKADTAELKKIESVLTDVEVSGGSLRLERKGPNDLKWQYVAKFKIEDFSQEHIQKVYGGGDYRAQTFRSSGGFYKRFDFTIDYRFKGAMDFGANDPKAVPSDNNAGLALQISQQNNSNALMLDIMNKAQASSSQNMLLMVNMMNESSKQNMAMMSGMFSALAAAMGKSAPDPVQSYMPLMLEMVKSSGNQKGGQTTSMTEVISAMRELSALAKGEAPAKEEKEEDMLDKVMKYGGPLITALLTRTPLQMPGAVAPAAGGQVIDMQPQAPVVQQPKVMITPPPASAPNEMVQKINMYMEVLISAAEKNSDPGAYAQMISDMLSDEHFATLLGELESPDWFAKVADGNPQVIAQQVWFTSLRTELFALLQDEQSTTTPEQNGGGNPIAAAGQGSAAQAG
jgi:hypothetical protein